MCTVLLLLCLFLGRRAWQPNRERTPQNDTASGTGSTPSGGGGTGGSSDPW
jgi:hypothetical protein